MKRCPICNIEYEPTMRWQKYCSPKCQSKGWSLEHKGRRKPLKDRLPKVEKRQCKRCKKIFISSNYNQVYCSLKCQDITWKKNNKDIILETGKRYKKNHPDRVKLKSRKYWLNRRYNITIEKYNEMLKNQDGKCAICHKEKEETLAVDHDHKTRKVRGLLCSNCNKALGYIRDDIKIVRAIEKYLTS